MSKYTEKEKNFLDKAAIAYMQGNIVNKGFVTRSEVDNAYPVALILLTERKKLFADE